MIDRFQAPKHFAFINLLNIVLLIYALGKVFIRFLQRLDIQPRSPGRCQVGSETTSFDGTKDERLSILKRDLDFQSDFRLT